MLVGGEFGDVAIALDRRDGEGEKFGARDEGSLAGGNLPGAGIIDTDEDDILFEGVEVGVLVLREFNFTEIDVFRDSQVVEK